MKSINWKSALFSALICFAIQLTLLFLVAGLGLTVFPIESGPTALLGILLAVSLLLTLAISFGVSGYLSAVMATTRHSGVFQAGATWAIVIFVSALFLGNQLGENVSQFLNQKGLIATSRVGLASIIEELKKVNPRVVTDMNIFKGKVVSSIELNSNPPGIMSVAANKIKSQPGLQQTLRQDAKTALQTLGLIALFSTLCLLVSGSSALFGGWWFDHHPQMALRGKSSRYFPLDAA